MEMWSWYETREEGVKREMDFVDSKRREPERWNCVE
jgi:hypothetical protein